MEITLQQFDKKGKATGEKVFHTTFICGKAFRDAFKITNKLMNLGGIISPDMKSIDVSKVDINANSTLPDELANFIVEIFNKQFTVDEFWQGIDARDILKTAIEGIQEITGGTAKKSKELAKANPN